MKKIKVNLLAIIGMMVAVATLAFNAPKEKVNTLATPFTYLGSDLDKDSFIDEGNWSTTIGTQQCGGSEIPCEVNITEPSVTDVESLVDHLSLMSESAGAQFLLDAATELKN